MNSRVGPLVIAAAVVAAGTLLATGPATRTPEDCPTGSPVAARRLARPVPVARCHLAGALVTNGALAVSVPLNEGETVVAAGSARGGHPAVLVVTRADGAVRARLQRPDGDRQPVERMGRADPPAAAPQAAPAEYAPDRRCADSAGTWLGMRWRGTYRWTFNGASVPGYLGDRGAVREAVRAAGRAVDDGRNDCGLAADLGQSQRYTGETRRDADIRPDGSCDQRDGRNVVAFGPLDGGLLALTCLWWAKGRTVEADVRISATPGMFTLDPGAGCADRWDLQGTVTHEFGHVFGLGHVAYAQHGDLTMSDGLPACTARFRALGLGDYLTLRAHYGG